jgi:hypothetical protein
MKYISLIIIIALIIIFGCDTPADMNRSGDKLSGYVLHTDTNLVFNGGFYSVSIFNADSADPFHRVPVRTDSLKITRRLDLVYETMYDMNGVPAGSYFVAATWSTYPRAPNEIPAVLGTYGCDTSRTCNSHVRVVYPNFDGNFRNIVSWTDPARRLN